MVSSLPNHKNNTRKKENASKNTLAYQAVDTFTTKYYKRLIY